MRRYTDQFKVNMIVLVKNKNKYGKNVWLVGTIIDMTGKKCKISVPRLNSIIRRYVWQIKKFKFSIVNLCSEERTIIKLFDKMSLNGQQKASKKVWP
ncbi:unnamed protein product [Meloidogyne enterolobii]|uniref:Uncharacterized protein n=1 Tax=Meloidogyne enterolobii TaxID=390850 RepID=A0ACB1A7P9_MELEN